MRPLAERQDDLAAALLNAALPIPDGLIGPDGEPSPTRFAVYRSNVVVSLIEALKMASCSITTRPSCFRTRIVCRPKDPETVEIGRHFMRDGYPRQSDDKGALRL